MTPEKAFVELVQDKLKAPAVADEKAVIEYFKAALDLYSRIAEEPKK